MKSCSFILFGGLLLLVVSSVSQECASLPAGPIVAFYHSLQAPKAKETKVPPLPEEAERLGAEGKVVMALVVDTEGRVSATSILRHAGMGLDELAREATRNWRFEPARLRQSKLPIAVSLNIDLWFRAPVLPENELAVRRIHFPFLGAYERPMVLRYRPIPWEGKRLESGRSLVIAASVNVKGRLQHIRIERGLDEQTNLEAVEALKSWSFRPAYSGSTPREAEVTMEFAPPQDGKDSKEAVVVRQASAHIAEAERLRGDGKLREALAAVLRAKEAQPFTILGDYMHGQILLEMGQPAEAVGPLLEATRRMPFEAEVYAALGRAYESIGLHTTAVAYQSCAVRLRPDWPDYWESRAEYQHRAGNAAGAMADQDQASRLRKMRSE